MTGNLKNFYLQVTEGLIQGPRMKSEATIQLENVARALLVNDAPPVCAVNEKSELEITVGDKSYNITQILKHQPDYEHLQFSDEEIDKYVAYVNNNAAADIPYVNYVRSHFLDTDLTKPLHQGEKIAISLYTDTDFSARLQRFLWQNAQDLGWPPDSKIFLLTTCIAAHGLNKLQKIEDNEEYQVLYRGETGDEGLHQRRIASMSSREPLRSDAFTSTSESNDSRFGGKIVVTIVQPRSAVGKKVDELSFHSHEKEALIPPGMQFMVANVEEAGAETKVTMIPVRSLNGILNPNALKTYLEQHEVKKSQKENQLESPGTNDSSFSTTDISMRLNSLSRNASANSSLEEEKSPSKKPEEPDRAPKSASDSAIDPGEKAEIDTAKDEREPSSSFSRGSLSR